MTAQPIAGCVLHSAQRTHRDWERCVITEDYNHETSYIYILYVYIFMDAYRCRSKGRLRQKKRDDGFSSSSPTNLLIGNGGKRLLLLQSSSWHDRAAWLHVGRRRNSRSALTHVPTHTWVVIWWFRVYRWRVGLCLCRLMFVLLYREAQKIFRHLFFLFFFPLIDKSSLTE